ncbi:MAG: zinc ribbon domain-containing protein [Bacteroidales bacterium]
MEKKNKICQSCGMPMKKDSKMGGSNEDGSIQYKYCSYCYENGKFKQADITVQEMQVFVKEKMKELGFPRILGWFFTSGIPRLERWKKQL